MKDSQHPLLERLNIPRLLVYAMLLFYAGISLLPLIWMTSVSMMTLGEVNAGLILPRAVNISPCILVSSDDYRVEGQIISRTRMTISIPEEAAQRQGGIAARSALREANVVNRTEHFRIPFITNYCAAWQEANLGRYIYNTLRIVLITVAGTVTFCTLAAYAFARIQFAGRELLFALMLTTLMIPDIVTDLPNFLIVSKIGEYFGSGGLGWCETRNCWTNNWPA